MALNVAVLNKFLSINARLPTRKLGTLEETLRVCCALHNRFKEEGLEGGGCCDMYEGTHDAVRSLRGECDNYVCHAEVGQRVLDYRLFSMAVAMGPSVVKDVYERPVDLWHKYGRGFAVDVSVYGKGYCYLAPIIDTARSRVARCLGPLPLVVDVVRMMLIVGERCSGGYALRCVAKGKWHVDLSGVLSFWDLMLGMISVISEDKNAEIGVTSRDVKEVIKSYVSAAGISSAGVLTGRLYPGFMGIYVEHRLNRETIESLRLSLLVEWFFVNGVVVPFEAYGKIVVAARDYYNTSDIVDIRLCRVWADLGSYAVRGVMAAYCEYHSFDEGRTGRFFGVLKDRALADAFRTSGLMGHCVMSSDPDSTDCKAVFCSLIGVISLYCEGSTVRSFLEKVGVLPCDPSGVRRSSDSGTLTGRHYPGFMGFYPETDVPSVVNDDYRSSLLNTWLASYGINLPDQAHGKLSFSTCQPTMLSGANARMRYSWQCLGESAIMCVAAAYCEYYMVYADSLSGVRRYGSDRILADAFRTSGLIDCCHLSSDFSVDNCSAIVKALVGVVSLYCEGTVVRKLLDALGAVPHVPGRVIDEQDVGSLDIDAVRSIRLTGDTLYRAQLLAYIDAI